MAATLPPDVRKAIASRAWQLRMDGLTQAAIADRLAAEFPAFPVGQSSVSRSLARTAERAVAQLDTEAKIELFRQLAQLRQIDAEAAAAFERSKAPKKETTGTKVGEKQTARIRTTEREGNPVWLGQRLAVWDRINRLFHLEERFAPPPPAADPADTALTVADVLAGMEGRDADHPAPTETPAAEYSTDGHES